MSNNNTLVLTFNQEKLKALNTLMLFTLTDVEPILGVSHRTLLNYVKSGKLKATKIGGKWKVSIASLKAFINGENAD